LLIIYNNNMYMYMYMYMYILNYFI